MRGGPAKFVTHPELNYGPGISGSTPFILSGGHGGGQGKVLQHPEMNYGPGVSGELKVTHGDDPAAKAALEGATKEKKGSSSVSEDEDG